MFPLEIMPTICPPNKYLLSSSIFQMHVMSRRICSFKSFQVHPERDLYSLSLFFIKKKDKIVLPTSSTSVESPGEFHRVESPF